MKNNETEKKVVIRQICERTWAIGLTGEVVEDLGDNYLYIKLQINGLHYVFTSHEVEPF